MTTEVSGRALLGLLSFTKERGGKPVVAEIVGKLSEPRVNEAMSGLSSPSRSSTSARSSNVLKTRPDVDTHTIASGQRPRTLPTISA